MIEVLEFIEAKLLFETLPPTLRVATLHPTYVAVDVVRDDRLQPIFLCYREAASFWLYSAHIGRVLDTGWHDLQSPYGYGGPVANSELPEFIQRACSAFKVWCRSNKVLAEFVRFHPIANNQRFFRGEIRDNRTTVAVPLQDNALESGFATRTRRGIKKAINAGVEAEWFPQSDIYKLFPSFYRSGMVALGADGFYLFSDEYFDALANLPGARLLVCLDGQEILSAGVFLFGEEVVEYHLGSTSIQGKESYSSYLMFKAVAELARLEGKEWLYLGGGTSGDPENSLLYFKAGFSKHSFSFNIGYQIFDAEAYDELMKCHRASLVGEETRRILFYR